MRAIALLFVTVVVAVATAAPANAQAVDVEVIASGLDNPRHVALSPRGDVYVAEAGRGGKHASSPSCFDSAEGFACTGATGAVTRISRHHREYHQKRVLKRLASFAPANGSSAIGPHGVYVKGRKVLVTNGGPTAPMRNGQVVLRDPTLVAEDPVSRLYGTLLKLRRHGGYRLVADIWRFEHDNNPDEQVGNRLIDSNPVDVLATGGRYIVADAGGNSILRINRRGRIRVLTLFPNVDTPTAPPLPPDTIPMNAVPTGVVKGPDGAYYVSQLPGYPFPLGGANVFRVDPRTGDRDVYATGFTSGMDLAFARDGTLYVLEIDSNSLLQPGTEGGLWAVPPGGGSPQRIALPAGTLTEPGGIAVGSDGDLFVSNHGREAGVGEVLKIELDD